MLGFVFPRYELMSLNLIPFVVNLVHQQGLHGTATMGTRLPSSERSASSSVDGSTDQNSCATTELETSVWWKVWLEKPFNIAYLEIYFKSSSKYKIEINKQSYIYI